MVVNYRQAYKMFACNGIMYNHESRRRPSEFVTQKIAEGAVAIKLGRLSKFMWLMLQRKRPDDYVIATGITHSVRDFCEIAFSKVGLDYEKHVVIDPALFRPTDVECLVGDASKAKRELGWKPKTGFDELVAEMVDAAMERLS
jgi:GDPmannose 4,6-dehydratase